MPTEKISLSLFLAVVLTGVPAGNQTPLPYVQEGTLIHKQHIHSLHRKTVRGKKGMVGWLRVFWGECEEFRSVQRRRLTSSSHCSPGGNSTGGQQGGNQCVTAPRPESRLTQTRVITSLMIPDHTRLRHVPPTGSASSSPLTSRVGVPADHVGTALIQTHKILQQHPWSLGKNLTLRTNKSLLS